MSILTKENSRKITSERKEGSNLKFFNGLGPILNRVQAIKIKNEK